MHSTQEVIEEAPRAAQSTPKKPRSPLVNRRSNRDEVIEEKEEKPFIETKEAHVSSSPSAQIKPPATPRSDTTSQPAVVTAVQSPPPQQPAVVAADNVMSSVEDAEKDSKAIQNQRSSFVKPKKSFSAAASSSADIPISVAVPSKSTRAEQKAGNNITENKAEPIATAPVAVNPIAPKPTYPSLPEKVNPAQPALTLSRQSAAPPQQAPPSRQGRSALTTGPQPQPQHPQLLKNVKDGMEITFESSDSQRVKKEWVCIRAAKPLLQ